MKFKFFILLLFFTHCSSIFAQNQKQIDFYKSKLYEYQTIGIDSALFYTEKIFVSKKPIDLAFAYAAKWQLLKFKNQELDEIDYLNKIKIHFNNTPKTSNNFYDLARVYNIVGSVYFNENKFSDALTFFLKAEKYALLNGDVNQIIKVKGNIATVKGDLKLVNDAISDIKELLILIDNSKARLQKENFEELKTRNKLNLGTFYIANLIDSKKKPCADSAKVVFNELLKDQINDFYRAETYTKLGVLYTELKEYPLAVDYYKKGIPLFSKIGNENEVITNIYNIGFNQFQSKNFKEAKKNFLAVIKKKKDTVINFEFLFTHKYLASIYTLEKNDSAVYYMERFLEYYSKKTEREKLELSKSYSEIEKKDLNDEIADLKQSINHGSRLKTILFSVVALLIAFVLWLGFKYFKNKKETESKLNELLEKVIDNNKIRPKSFSKLKITNENEQKIIDGLEKLEREKYFLRTDFNLHNVAKKIGSNTTYLTSVIKTYKEMSFNDYTNELRINYILSELLVDKKLQNYTIQSLAEQVGYKKGASFSKIFKQKTGVTPFQYIEKLKSNT